MATSKHHILGSLELPRTLIWVDEFDWVAPLRAHEYSLTGALIVDQAVRQAGRPITLEGVANHGWVRRDVLTQLHTLASTAGGPLPLTLADGRTYAVRFAPGDPLQAHAIARAELPPDAFPYYVTLRLVTA